MRIGILGASLLSVATAASAQSVIDIDQIVASGLSRPVYATSAHDGSGRLFIVEQAGTIRILDAGVLLPVPFLDITSRVSSNGEQGLLSVAFHPQFTTNGFFYVNYTDLSGDTVVARYRVSAADENRADLTSASTVIAIDQPYGNHNGGQLQFGPLDGYLYIGMGDGGSARDPHGHGQNKNTLLGDLLRVDVDGGSPYAIPEDNPYVGTAGADEIWASGLRNPWRFSFDRGNGDLYIADVGQSAWEEIDFQAAGTPGGLNFGWVVREGPCPLATLLPCSPAPAIYTDPIAYYGRSDGGSVTGGYVYRGSDYPLLDGRYFYGDFSSGRIWSITKTSESPIAWSPPMVELATGFNVSTFGEDEAGELYVANYFGGTLHRIRSSEPPAMIAPAPLSTLTGRQETFQWSAEETPVQEWWLYAGATAGGKEYFDSGFLGTATSATALRLPTNGSAVHVRLWYRVRGLWRFSDFRYTAATIPAGTPAITSPSPGSTLAPGANLFQWTDNFAPVGAWWLYAGSRLGANDYFDSRALDLNTSASVTGLPTDGSTVYVRLWFFLAGAWEFVDTTFIAATVGVPEITSPAAGSTLGGASVPFQWTANGELVDEWWLYAGSIAGGRDILDTGSLGTATGTTILVPTDGRQIHVRLYFRVGAQWRLRDFSYTAAMIAPAITSPSPGSTLAGRSVSFSWTANGESVAEWWLYFGSTLGGLDIADSGSLGSSTGITVNVPTDGRQVHVRLWYRVGAQWRSRDFQYTAALIQPAITAPSPGSTLAGSSVLFSWTSNGFPVTEWWIYAGSAPGGKEYLDSGSLGAALQATLSGLPVGGSIVHLRLWYRIAGLWQFSDFTFTAAP
jgi:glucose/arabinose dehydrogenase